MNLFAVIENGVVTQILSVKDNIFELQTLFRHKSTTTLLVNIDAVDPQPQVGWTYSDGTFTHTV